VEGGRLTCAQFIATLAVNVPIIRALFSTSAWINSNRGTGPKGYSNGHELANRSRLKSHQGKPNNILGSQGDGTYRGDSTDKIVDGDGRWKDDGDSRSNISLTNAEGSDSSNKSKGPNPFVIHTTTTYSVNPTKKSGGEGDQDKNVGAKAWVSAV
jgi:hypothetical protein